MTANTSGVYCRHCNVEVGTANNGFCTNSGCGKKLSNPIRKNRSSPVVEFKNRVVGVGGSQSLYLNESMGPRQRVSMYRNVAF